MMPSNEQRRAEERPPYPAEQARQGRIILRTRAQRIVFIAGLVGAVLLALAWILLSAPPRG